MIRRAKKHGNHRLQTPVVFIHRLRHRTMNLAGRGATKA